MADEKKPRTYTEEEHNKALVAAIEARSRMPLCVNIDIGLHGGVTNGPTLAPRAVVTITGGDLAKVCLLYTSDAADE